MTTESTLSQRRIEEWLGLARVPSAAIQTVELEVIYITFYRILWGKSFSSNILNFIHVVIQPYSFNIIR